MSQKTLQVKHYQNNKRYLLAIGIILSIVVFASSIHAKDDLKTVSRADQIVNMNYNCFSDSNITYLLGSGLTDCQKASVRYILWTEDLQQIDIIEKSLKANNIVWTCEELKNAYGNQAIKFTISRTIDLKQEKEIDSMIKYLYNSFDRQKVGVYFEERINAGINPRDYFRLNNVITDQSGQAEKILAFTGYADTVAIRPQVNTKFNIEVLSSVKSGSVNFTGADKRSTEKTVLAIPALIEEF